MLLMSASFLFVVVGVSTQYVADIPRQLWLQWALYMDSDWIKKLITPPPQIVTECLHDAILFNVIIYSV